MRRFVEMCFDPNSPMNERLKQTLIEMLGEEKNEEFIILSIFCS